MVRAPITCAVMCLLIQAAGCSGTLKSEFEIPRFASLAKQYAVLDRQIVRYPTARPGEPALHIAMTKIGSRKADEPILVFVHGAFSDSDAWRYIAGELGASHRLWLVDLPGCGASDKPSPRKLARNGYGAVALGDRIYQAVKASLEDGSEAGPIVFVAHSYGALVVTRMLGDPELRAAHSDVLGRTAGAVLFTPLDVAIEKPLPVLEVVARISDIEIALADALGILQRRMTVGVADSYDDPSIAPQEEVDRGMHIITDSASRHATQAIILQATPRRAGAARPDWPEVERISKFYANIDVPVAIACGAHDETLPASMGYKLKTQIRGATLDVIPDCMHSPHLERPADCIRIIENFLKRLPATKPASDAAIGPGRRR
jgi:pimeloyl-ACP methyl ester carboxylesterase